MRINTLMKFRCKEKNEVHSIHNTMKNIVLKKKKRNTLEVKQPLYLANPQLSVKAYNI